MCRAQTIAQISEERDREVKSEFGSDAYDIDLELSVM
jgi:hypothetical protein